MKRKKIYLSPTDNAKLLKKFGCTKSTASESLCFKRHSMLSQQIRVYAMNFLSSAQIVEY